MLASPPLSAILQRRLFRAQCPCFGVCAERRDTESGIFFNHTRLGCSEPSGSTRRHFIDGKGGNSSAVIDGAEAPGEGQRFSPDTNDSREARYHCAASFAACIAFVFGSTVPCGGRFFACALATDLSRRTSTTEVKPRGKQSCVHNLGHSFLHQFHGTRPFHHPSHSQDPAPNRTVPFVVFLGTGHSGPTPNRQGPSLAVIAGGKAYLADVGVGVVRQADTLSRMASAPSIRAARNRFRFSSPLRPHARIA